MCPIKENLTYQKQPYCQNNIDIRIDIQQIKRH